MKPQCKPIVCKDGFRMSVQASAGHYCSPKNDTGPYVSVEVYSDGSEPLLKADDGGISGWTPAKVVMDVIVKHGGIRSGELPNMTVRRVQQK